MLNFEDQASWLKATRLSSSQVAMVLLEHVSLFMVADTQSIIRLGFVYLP